MTTIAAVKRAAGMSRAPVWISLAVGFIVVVIWLSIPWSWSTIDDAGFALSWMLARQTGATLGYGSSQILANF